METARSKHKPSAKGRKRGDGVPFMPEAAQRLSEYLKSVMVDDLDRQIAMTAPRALVSAGWGHAAQQQQEIEVSAARGDSDVVELPRAAGAEAPSSVKPPTTAVVRVQTPVRPYPPDPNSP